MHQIEEKIVIYNGELKYAVCLTKDAKSNYDKTYLSIRDGKVYFESNWYGGIREYDGSEESHQIAKSIFMSELQCAVRKRVSELKLLESVLNDIGISDVLGNVMFESQKMLITQQIEEAKEEIKEVVEDKIEKTVDEKIVKIVKPKAIKKPNPKKEA